MESNEALAKISDEYQSIVHHQNLVGMKYLIDHRNLFSNLLNSFSMLNQSNSMINTKDKESFVEENSKTNLVKHSIDPKEFFFDRVLVKTFLESNSLNNVDDNDLLHLLSYPNHRHNSRELRSKIVHWLLTSTERMKKNEKKRKSQSNRLKREKQNGNINLIILN